MLEIVAKGFREAKAALTGHATLTDKNITDAVRKIRVSLLEADVELGVVRSFLARVKERAIGEVVPLSVTAASGKKATATPGEHFIQICQNELEALMGPVEASPIAFRRPVTTIMMVGLQGVGKTTTCGKLARHLLEDKRKPMLVAADIYRPAAVQQLQKLGSDLGVPVYAQEGTAPGDLCVQALAEARKLKRDVVIFDTAGRLAIDDALMGELEDIQARTKPHNVYLVCDAMAGQDTVNTASEFNRRLELTGFVMTKLDGDARGGAALSIKEITGKPIKFLGTGEDMGKLEPFRPEGLASRILGMGDVVGLMNDFESLVDAKQAERDTKKLLKGQFTLEDFLGHLRMFKQLGSAKDLYERFPIFGDAVPEGAEIDDKAFVVMESMLHSMTPEERRDPKIIDKSRTKRIAAGSGRKPEQVTDLLQRFGMMHQMMAGFASQPGLLANLPGLKQLGQLKNMRGQAKAMRKLMGRGGGGRMPAGMPGGMGGMAGGMPGGMGGGALAKLLGGGGGGGGAVPGGMPDMASIAAAAGGGGAGGGAGAAGLPGLGGAGAGGLAGAAAAAGGIPGMPGMPGMPSAGGAGDGAAGAPGGLPPGVTPEQMAQMMQAYGMGGGAPDKPKKQSSAQKARAKNKRKSQKQARKRGRKR